MKIISLILIVITFSTIAKAQPSWKADESHTKQSLNLFNSTSVFSLPTTETQSKGDIYFGIYHKFVLPVSNGVDDLFGIDGSVVMRIALGYTPIENLFLNFGRSNRDGNYDLQAKYKLLDVDNSIAPMNFAVNAGIAYNTKLNPEPIDKSRLFQYFFSFIGNAMIDKKIGVGIVPTYLINSNCNCAEVQNSFTIGAYLQYYFNEHWSAFVEANPTISGWRYKFDTYTIGTEYEIGGHFFKIILSNNTGLNSVHIHSGAGDSFDSGDLHLGFVISRVL